jgi:hypothetical protein
VEPCPDEVKFIRNHGFWRYIIEVSRELLEDKGREQIDIDVARIAILLERHRATHDAYPEALDSLIASLGDGMPQNPFRGGSYYYERHENTYHLGYESELPPLPDDESEMPFTHWVFWNDPKSEIAIAVTEQEAQH